MGRSVRAALLDSDGTLLDTLPALFEAYCDFLKQFDLEGTQEEFDHLNGMPLRQFLYLLKEKHKLNIDLEKATKTYNELLDPDSMQLHLGADDFLRYLQEKQIAIALVTSAPRKIVDRIYNRLELLPFFDVVVTGDDVDKGKPHPDIFLEALKQLNAQPKNSFAVEDSLNGVLAALRAGIPTYYFGTGKKHIDGAIAVDSWKSLNEHLKSEQSL